MIPAWMKHARCRTEDPLLFFGADDEKARDRQQREAQARAVCVPCPVSRACLEFRLARPRQDDGGIWGGLDGDERSQLLRNRRRSARKADAA